MPATWDVRPCQRRSKYQACLPPRILCYRKDGCCSRQKPGRKKHDTDLWIYQLIFHGRWWDFMVLSGKLLVIKGTPVSQTGCCCARISTKDHRKWGSNSLTNATHNTRSDEFSHKMLTLNPPKVRILWSNTGITKEKKVHREESKFVVLPQTDWPKECLKHHRSWG